MKGNEIPQIPIIALSGDDEAQISPNLFDKICTSFTITFA
jgi:hypothetical protein